MENNLSQNIISIYGAAGEKWLEKLPHYVSAAAERYQLSDVNPVQNMTFNYVATAIHHGKNVILKIGMDARALSKESAALKAFAQHGAPNMLVAEDKLLLMERAIPGKTLKTLFPTQEHEATDIFCALAQKLHSVKIPTHSSFQTMEEILSDLDKKTSVPHDIINKSRKLRDALLQTSTQQVLLHGDLHHDNILLNGDNWIAIDPKGFIGDPVFELAPYLFNPIPELLAQNNARERVMSRVNQCAKILKIPAKRVHDALFVRAVLAWVWCLEDNHDPVYFERFINLIAGYSS